MRSGRAREEYVGDNAMKPHPLPPAGVHRFDFSFPRLDTLVRVEEGEDGVLVRATRDSFTDERKRFFIRELAAEGFIPEQVPWLPSGVRWVVDFSWLELSPVARRRANRTMVAFLVSGVVLWVALMGLSAAGARRGAQIGFPGAAFQSSGTGVAFSGIPAPLAQPQPFAPARAAGRRLSP